MMIRIAVLIVLLLPTATLGSNAGVLEVVQVFAGMEFGSEVIAVPYVEYRNEPLDPVRRVVLTAAPNAIRGPSGEFENRNAAALLGIVIKPWMRHGIRADTIAVTVDLSGIDERPYQLNPGHEPARWGHHYDAEKIVPAVLDCMRLNAASGFPAFRYLSVDIVGDPRFASRSGVYALEAVKTGLHN